MRYMYDFDERNHLDDPVALLGNKGANLAEMTRLKLPVPPGFTLTTDACQRYQREGKISDDLKKEVKSHLNKLGRKLGRFYADPKAPLLLSVRSGASVSMPGMMETILNVGLTSLTLEGFKSFLNDERAALDCYRRFLQMYGSTVCGLSTTSFQKLLQQILLTHHCATEYDLTPEALKALSHSYESFITTQTGGALPQDPDTYLWQSIEAVFKSWQNPRAQTYRRLYDLSDELGTAVTIQAMVFGNLDERSASGVAFTRHPSTGENILYGEYMRCAQGEDVVAGTHTPHSLTQGSESLATQFPAAFKELKETASCLEKHFQKMQDIEFTIESGKLWMLQTRQGKCSAEASVRMAVDMVRQGLITKQQALLNVNPLSLEHLLLPRLASENSASPFVQGFAGAPGAASGRLVMTAEEAVACRDRGEKVILVRPETNADDVHGIWAAEGILTQKGGTTSHAAVVARGMGKPCIVGAHSLEILDNGQMTAHGITVKKGDILTLDGHTGRAYLGDLPRQQPRLTHELKILMQWADQYRKLGIRANAETKADLSKALEFGAEGVGLCRTEHMFFDPNHLLAFQKVILSESDEERSRGITALKPLQKKGFREILTLLQGRPLTVRLLDPPLHEFIPSTPEDCRRVAQALGISEKDIQRRQKSLKELNPMLGHRGCRLAISFPDLYGIQARALFESALELQKEGLPVQIELMIPLISTASEVTFLKKLIQDVQASVERDFQASLSFAYGCMVETPRAALTASDIAQHVDFFSFGTNDLTQLTYGLSRDDFGSFWPAYDEKKLFSHNPFVTLDREGVGSLISTTVSAGRSVHSSLKIGVCGEHAGDPASIYFCHQTGINYLSCSPYRVLCAKLAAAQAALGIEEKTDERGALM